MAAAVAAEEREARTRWKPNRTYTNCISDRSRYESQTMLDTNGLHARNSSVSPRCCWFTFYNLHFSEPWFRQWRLKTALAGITGAQQKVTQKDWIGPNIFPKQVRPCRPDPRSSRLLPRPANCWPPAQAPSGTSQTDRQAGEEYCRTKERLPFCSGPSCPSGESRVWSSSVFSSLSPSLKYIMGTQWGTLYIY